ncbi:MAG: radical SAM protein, partial [Desulfobacterales bacterium]|nr:radical SAM protein [Desulfobacterales bacterium]
TVLENPHWDEFDRELDEGYDVVGFQLKSLHTKKISRMMKRIREKSPGTKIVVGGYGVNTLATPLPGDTNGDAIYIRDNADYICQEEGVGFMRKILDDHPIDREITQYHMPMTGSSVAGLNFQARIPSILVALGCPNACDFCNTSAMFKHKKIYVAEPEQTYRYMKHNSLRLKYNDVFTILFDEDFFINKEYVQELGRLLRSDEKTAGIKYFTFGSIRSLSQFDAEELRDNGLGAVWIGVESFLCGDNLTTDQYQKRGGKEVKELFANLHKNGIETTASLVLGFDYHTPENLKSDIDQFIDLKPTFYQISPLTPCPGTALYDRMSEEGRILDTYNWEDVNLWKDDVFQLKNFKPGEIKGFYDYAHDQISEKLGPPIMQMMESMLDTHKNLKENEKNKQTSLSGIRNSKMAALGSYTYLGSIEANHEKQSVRDRAKMLKRRYENEIGKAPLAAKGASKAISYLVKRKARNKPSEKISDPPPRWSYYNTFDDRVWVKKGREAKRPVPYKDRRLISRAKSVHNPILPI